MPFHERARFPRGFRCASTNCGIKAEGPDLSLFTSDVPASAAAVFTRNQVPGAPIVVGRELIRDGRLQAVVVNSRVSNVGTGAEGIERARRMGRAAAEALGIGPDLVLMSSTGVIGVPLPIDRIEAALPRLAAGLQDDPTVGAEGIMTTDTRPKALSLSVGKGTLTVVGKGSGMIEPNLATMLVYGFTDVEIEAPALDAVLRAVVDDTLNMLSIDTDTSTSDTCALLANGRAGPVEPDVFARALTEAFTEMTERLARDGEGASAMIRVTITGAADRGEARTVAKSLVNSPLVKTMVFGGDPNVGRILMAVGKCFDCRVEPERIAARICGVDVLAGGVRTGFDEAAVRALLGGDPVDLEVDLGVGAGRARAWGCDLTHGYIDENAAYYSS
ncbi:MAG TPA: bifunctional glutamate N-acetyltransferase/amino-acid acetyltransferase ArgJ [Longimicrobiales bacterium]|nr:bifunctional glutamate N-acetyltransferase/amino-acid acetyltransferase ArgJ [Longimicrobiales bacterium]